MKFVYCTKLNLLRICFTYAFVSSSKLCYYEFQEVLRTGDGGQSMANEMEDDEEDGPKKSKTKTVKGKKKKPIKANRK
jgi:hypothetical protein